MYEGKPTNQPKNDAIETKKKGKEYTFNVVFNDKKMVNIKRNIMLCIILICRIGEKMKFQT